MSNTQLNLFTVHPHTGGEHTSQLDTRYFKTGSSPSDRDILNRFYLLLKSESESIPAIILHGMWKSSKILFLRYLLSLSNQVQLGG